MALFAEVIFWISFFILFYTYLGYPILLLVLVGIKRTLRRNEPGKEASELTTLPPITLIITAYNEAEILRKKIKNIEELLYPKHLLTVLFVTDGSTDESVSLIKAHREFKLLHQQERSGKLAAMNRAIDHVQTPIVIFNDANGMLNPSSIRHIIKHYEDPHVGAVSGEKKVVKQNDSGTHGEGLYWKYESILKKLDSELLTVVGAAGELFSIRTALYQKLENVVIEDFVQSLLLCEKGYVVRYEAKAFSQEEPSPDLRDEVERKIRISAGGFQAIIRLKSLFNIFRHPLLTFMYVSHRVLRWTICPPALILLLLSGWAFYILTGSTFYLLAGTLQLVFYLFACIGWRMALMDKKISLFHFPFYFMLMNWCVVLGFLRYISGSQTHVWKKARRTSKI